MYILHSALPPPRSLVSRSQTFSSQGAYRLEIISARSERVWYTDRQILVTASTLLPWALIGVKSQVKEVSNL